MTTRADLIEAAARALCEMDGFDWPYCNGVHAHRADAATVLNAVLPQITTVEQLEAYGEEALVLTRQGQPLLVGDLRGWDDIDLLGVGPLTVVWQPQPEQEPT